MLRPAGIAARTAATGYGSTTQPSAYQRIATILSSNAEEAAKYVNWKPSIFDKNTELNELYKQLTPEDQTDLKTKFNSTRFFAAAELASNTSPDNLPIIRRYNEGRANATSVLKITVSNLVKCANTKDWRTALNLLNNLKKLHLSLHLIQ